MFVRTRSRYPERRSENQQHDSERFTQLPEIKFAFYNVILRVDCSLKIDGSLRQCR